MRLSARINADDEGLKSYRRASVTSFGMEEEEFEDEKDWRQIQLKAAGISTSTRKIMKQQSSTKGKGGMINNLLNNKK